MDSLHTATNAELIEELEKRKDAQEVASALRGLKTVGEFFVVKLPNGNYYSKKWWKSKGSLSEARVYNTIGTARSFITRWSKSNGGKTPSLVRIAFTERNMTVLDETERVSKVKKAQAAAALLLEERKMEEAKVKLLAAQEAIKKLKGL